MDVVEDEMLAVMAAGALRHVQIWTLIIGIALMIVFINETDRDCGYRLRMSVDPFEASHGFSIH